MVIVPPHSRENLPVFGVRSQTHVVALRDAKGLVSARQNRHLPLRVAQGDILRVVVAFLLCFALPRPLDAHDIPATVLIRLFIKPDGDTLRVIVRAPLEAMRDINFPMRDSNRYLDIRRAEPLLREAAVTWIANGLQVYENDSLLTRGRISAIRISLPSDRSFGSYGDAVAHLRAPALPATIDLPWQQAMLDLELVYPIGTASSSFSIRAETARLGVRTTTVLRFLPAGGTERAFEYVGDPGLVRLDPHWYQAAGSFVRLGFFHIWSGIDHLLFVLCLVIPFRRLRTLIGIVTAFTVAHSITLIASTLGWAPGGLWFPPLIEVLIALSILYVALENIIAAARKPADGPDPSARGRMHRRWVVAFLFGLAHGFGFSFALRESLQFAGAHLATSLLSFNVGVELGQITVLLIAIPVLNFLFQRVVAERVGTIILSAFVAHTAWHWSTERWSVLRLYQPAAVSGVTWGIGFLLAAGVAVLAFMLGRKPGERQQQEL